MKDSREADTTLTSDHVSASRENQLCPCEFRPTSIAWEAADSVGQLGPIPVPDKVERIEQATQFEQGRALMTRELERGRQGVAARSAAR